MEGPPNLQVTLVADEHLGRKLAAATACIDEGRLDSDSVYDGLGEFLNVLCGNVAAALERDDVYVSLGPPVRDASLDGGIAFELVVGEGCASVVLATE
jgi:CheY-specific phosphatase CheX